MRVTQQKRQLLGNPHWTGTAQATSPLDKDAADQEVRGFRIPNGTGDCSPDEDARPRTTEAVEAEFPILQGRTPRHRKAKIARGWQDLRTMHDLRGLCSGDSLARFGGPVQWGPWQDSRTMHDSRGQCSEKGPSLARSSRGAFPKGGLRGFSDTWRANLAKASSFWMHGGDMFPGRGAFPVRSPFRNA